jgi:hypothetical protein
MGFTYRLIAKSEAIDRSHLDSPPLPKYCHRLALARLAVEDGVVPQSGLGNTRAPATVDPWPGNQP